MVHLFAFLLLALANVAYAGGPVAPDGWNGSHSPTLPNGQACCQPADLNGTGLVGGAFVLIADSKTHFAVFALTYDPKLRERWHLLERHPISKLSEFTVSIAAPKPSPFPGIKVCSEGASCFVYFLPSSKAASFKRIRLQ